jgi:prophage regulatory protein
MKKTRNIRPQTGDRLVALHELPEKGIHFSTQYLHAMVARGQFPRPIKLSPRKSVWRESAIDNWIAERAAQS